MQDNIEKSTLNADDTMHERNVLAKAIFDMAVKTGLYAEDANVTGPHLLMACADVTEHMIYLEKQNKELKLLAQKLLNGADSCTKAPHFIIQPFMNIVKEHVAIIGEHDLDEPLKKTEKE
jgi:hypothetical protein